MTAHYYKTDISWHPLIFVALSVLGPLVLYIFGDATPLSAAGLFFSFSGLTFQYFEMKFKTISIEGDTLTIKKIFGTTTVDIKQLKYAKLVDNNKVGKFLFGVGKQGVEIYGKWGFEVLQVENPHELLEDLKEKSQHFN